MKTTTIEKREGILDRGLLESALHALSDGRYRVRFDRERSKASWKQMGYYRSAVLPYIAQETGAIFPGMPARLVREALDSLHDDLLEYCAPQYSSRNRFDRRRRVRHILRTRDMSTKQFTDYVETIRLRFPEWDIPPPDDPRALEFYDEMIARYEQ